MSLITTPEVPLPLAAIMPWLTTSRPKLMFSRLTPEESLPETKIAPWLMTSLPIVPRSWVPLEVKA
ncbi:hypothetical protein D3C77_660890 [compost metagenome]